MSNSTGFTLGHGDLKVIVVHGWMAGRALFDPMHPFLDVATFTFAFMDCRGYGDRRDSVGPFDVRTIAEDILELADRLGWSVFSVLGHSMAGMSAQWLLETVPERIQSLVLLSTVPAKGASISQERRQLLESAMTKPADRRALIDINTGHRHSADWLDQTLALSLATTNPPALREYLKSWTQDGFEFQAGCVAVPALLLVGEADPGATLELMQDQVAPFITSSRLQQLPGVGHYAMREDPEGLVSATQAFISTAVARPA
ncbi:alpha/beta fold hydrolase [Pseudomonas syringae]|uniref:alpha/beta fold hydrolase n=1 Tax=Pseudomonas syringae TaxID=317 RepID=UPI000A223504|nr:alpha/beta hydrolase [Pseudomonas syringae]OSR71403.1 Tropinesterase [Pseudomonas syringae pv. actinidiae]